MDLGYDLSNTGSKENVVHPSFISLVVQSGNGEIPIKLGIAPVACLLLRAFGQRLGRPRACDLQAIVRAAP